MAVVFNLLYTFLYLNSSAWCYVFGILGPALLILVSISRGLYADPLLQLFYIGMAIYGWWPSDHVSGELPIARHSSWQEHVPWIIAGLLSALLAGLLLKKFTSAKLPFLDSVVSAFGMIGTWWMVNYVHENWLYFMGINALFIYICFARKMYLASLMYIIYLWMSIDGFFELKFFEL